MLSLRNIKLNNNISRLWKNSAYFCNKPTEENDAKPPGGYAKAFEKFETLNAPVEEKPATFASLLRNSKFIDVSC